MSRKRMISLLGVLLLLALAAGMTLALGSQPLMARSADDAASPQASVGSGFTYQGRLADGDGNPISNTCSLDFTLWDAENGGSVVGHQMVTGVEVNDGYLAVLLNSGGEFGEDAFTGQARWLKIGVKCSGDAGWSFLSGRQLLSAAPYALSLRPGALISGTVSGGGSVLEVSNNGLGSTGLGATSEYGNAIRGVSTHGRGGYLQGGIGEADLVLGGVDAAHDDGNLSSEPDYPSSDLNLFSNHIVAIHLDENNDEEDGRLLVWNGANQVALEVSEAGNLTLRNDLYLGSDGGPNGNILATAAAGADLALHTNDNIYADLDDDNDGNSCFIIRDGADANLWTQCGGRGMTTVGTSAVAVETDSGPREMYAVSSPGLWFEDFGSAALVDGQATVAIDPLFAEVCSLEAGYQVYLTPISTDLVLLSVTAKTPTAFEVRGATLDGQPADASFDYRIVAKRAGYEDYRMETAESMLDADAGQ
jgi:hypothetical protein